MSRTIDRTPKTCAHPCTPHQHGTKVMYDRDRCRCWPCTYARSAYERARYRSIAYQQWQPYTDTAPVRDRAAWRAARELGYTRLITYTQAGEPGSSLRAAGWRVIAERPAHAGWSRPSRPRQDRAERVVRTLWEATG